MTETVRSNEVEKLLEFIQPYLPDDEKKIGEKLIRENFDECKIKETMELSNEVQELKDRLDTLYMNYLSQVSLWKSKYYDLKGEKDK